MSRIPAITLPRFLLAFPVVVFGLPGVHAQLILPHHFEPLPPLHILLVNRQHVAFPSHIEVKLYIANQFRFAVVQIAALKAKLPVHRNSKRIITRG